MGMINTVLYKCFTLHSRAWGQAVAGFCFETKNKECASSVPRISFILKMTVFWDVAPCSPVETDRRFRGSYCLHHQGHEWWRQQSPLGVYTTQQPWRQSYSYSPPWEPEISPSFILFKRDSVHLSRYYQDCKKLSLISYQNSHKISKMFLQQEEDRWIRIVLVTISVDFDVIDQLLITYSEFVRYWRKNVSTVRQHISYLQT
jgi:hypothetical protein